MLRASIAIVFMGALLSACAYRPYAGDVKPLGEEQQASGVTVADDGTVTYTQGRLDIRLRPMSDEEYRDATRKALAEHVAEHDRDGRSQQCGGAEPEGHCGGSSSYQMRHCP